MTIDVEQIVREVIAELQRRGQADAPAPARATMPGATKSSAPSNDADELVVCSRVVSLAQIGDWLGHIRRLVVRPDAVVTPAARDALADRNIALVTGPTDGSAATAASRVLLVAARTTYDAGALAETLGSEGIAIETQTSDCLIRVADLLAVRVRDGATLGVVLTPEVAAALCLANRLPGVRAVSAADPGAVTETARAVGANVLVVDPRGKGLFPLKQVLSAFCRQGPWPCPKVLQPRLS